MLLGHPGQHHRQGRQHHLLVDEWTNLIANSKGLHINNDQNFSTTETTEFWQVRATVLTGGIDQKDAGTEFPGRRRKNNN